MVPYIVVGQDKVKDLCSRHNGAANKVGIVLLPFILLHVAPMGCILVYLLRNKQSNTFVEHPGGLVL